jgi:hypothetical protein
LLEQDLFRKPVPNFRDHALKLNAPVDSRLAHARDSLALTRFLRCRGLNLTVPPRD